MSAISPEDAKEILDELAKRSATCRDLAKQAEPFPTEAARLTSAACAWGYATDLVKEWIERVNADPPVAAPASSTESPASS